MLRILLSGVAPLAALLFAICVAVLLLGFFGLWLVPYSVLDRDQKSTARKAWMFSATIWSGAIFVGVMSGLSRVPVLADVLPAILVFLGGFFALITGTGLRQKLVAAFTMPVFALMIFVGDQIGAQKGSDFDHLLANEAWQNLPINLLRAAQAQRLAKTLSSASGISVTDHELNAIFDQVVASEGTLSSASDKPK